MLSFIIVNYVDPYRRVQIYNNYCGILRIKDLINQVTKIDHEGEKYP